MNINKCGFIDGKIVYCDEFTAMIKRSSEMAIVTDAFGSTFKVGNAVAAFNRCPYCKEWIPKDDK